MRKYMHWVYLKAWFSDANRKKKLAYDSFQQEKLETAKALTSKSDSKKWGAGILSRG